jgi:hypothetical protein
MFDRDAMKSMDREFQRRVLQGYLAVIVLVLTVVTYLILAGGGFDVGSEFVVTAILLIILISVNILQSIIGLRTLDYLDERESS